PPRQQQALPSTTDAAPTSQSTRFFSLLLRPPPSPTLFPYTTLFRSLPRDFSPTLEQITKNQSDYARLSQERKRLRGLYMLWLTLDRKSTRLNSSHSQISYAVFCLKKKKR